MPSLLNLSRIMIFNVHTWLPVTLFNLGPDQEIYRFNYSLMTSQLRRGRKKGQHIFENVNLNNVFWVCWKKAIIKCHLGPTASTLSLALFLSEQWRIVQHVQHWGLSSPLSRAVVCKVILQEGPIYWVMSICTAICHAMKRCPPVWRPCCSVFSSQVQGCGSARSCWRNFKMRRSAPIPLRANYMHITTAANS